MSAGQQIDVEIIKRGYLKYKTATSPGTVGTLASSNQYKSFKEFWFVFRVRKSTPKVCEFYNSEKDFLRRSSHPKGTIQLSDIQTIHKSGQDQSKQIVLNSVSGCLHILEASSVYEANKWITALNAVLFGRGIDGGNVVTFFVDVWDSPKLSYAGPGIMEITEDQIIVWNQDRQGVVINWKLRYIRMFKAKQDHFQVMAGSRSSTGEGIFQFGTQESVLITNTLGTVIELLADQRRQRPLSATSQTLSVPGIPVRSKSEKARGLHAPPPPPVPAPYGSSSVQTYSSLNRGRTDTHKALVPNYSDISNSMTAEYSTLEYKGGTSEPPPLPAAAGRGGAAPPPIPQYSAIGKSTSPASSTPAVPGPQEDVGGIYSDIDDYSYAEVDKKSITHSAAPSDLSHTPPKRGENDYSEVEGAALVPYGGGMDGYDAVHSSDLGQIRRTNLPADTSPELHNYSRLQKTASTYSQLHPVDPSTTTGGTFNPYNSMILMNDPDVLQASTDQGAGETYSTLHTPADRTAATNRYEDQNTYSTLHDQDTSTARYNDQATYSTLRKSPEKEEPNPSKALGDTYSALRTPSDISEHYEVSPQLQRRAKPPPSPVPTRTSKLPSVDQRTPEDIAKETMFEPEYSMESFYSGIAQNKKPVPSPKPKSTKKPAPVTTADPSAPPVPPRRGASRNDNQTGPAPPPTIPRQPRS